MGLYFNIALFLPLNKYNEKEVDLCGIVLEKYEKKVNGKNNYTYIIYVDKINDQKIYKRIKIKMYSKNKLEVGEIVFAKAVFEEGEISRNYKGFNEKNYLRQNGILGKAYSKNIDDIKVLGNDRSIYIRFFKLKYYFNKRINKIYDDENVIGFNQGLLFGNKNSLSDIVKKEFKENLISHVLAISGIHVGIVLVSISSLLDKLFYDYRLKQKIKIIFLLLFWFFTGMQVSCFRACFMNIVLICTDLRYSKYDIRKSFFISYLVLIIMNIYNITNIAVMFSFLSSISIIYFNSFFSKVFKLVKKNNFNDKNKSNNFRIIKFLRENLVVTVSAQVLMFPIVIYYFNYLTFNMFLSNIIVSIFIPILLKFGYIVFIVSLISIKFSKVLGTIDSVVFSIMMFLLDKLTKGNVLKAYFRSFSFVVVICLYILIYICNSIFLKNNYIIYRILIDKKNRKIRIKSIRIDIKNKLLIILIIVLLLINNSYGYFTNKGFKIHFVDVGQGDCTLIKTDSNKTILIDFGEGKDSGYDMGENVVFPYLLDRGIKTIDFAIVSHFDSDHVGGLFYLIENMKINNIVITKQVEETENFKELLKMISNKNINLLLVKRGDRLIIDRETFFEILWPDKNDFILENPINNNSLVCSLNYKNFKMLFTGDIEKEAENRLVNIYKETDYLNCNVLKTAHHGSKTSSTNEFIKLVNPQIVVIGVKKNNKFGHPDEEVINRFIDNNIKIFRTDLDGEISIDVFKDGKYRIKKEITKK